MDECFVERRLKLREEFCRVIIGGGHFYLRVQINNNELLGYILMAEDLFPNLGWPQWLDITCGICSSTGSIHDSSIPPTIMAGVDQLSENSVNEEIKSSPGVRHQLLDLLLFACHKYTLH